MEIINIMPARAIKILFSLMLIVGTLAGQTSQQNRIRIANDLERRGNYEGSLRIYKNLHSEAPHNYHYYDGVRRNLKHLKRFDELEQIIKSQIQLTRNLRYEIDLGDLYYSKGDYAAAMHQWGDVLKKYSARRSVYSHVANTMIANRLYDEAIEIYKLARTNLAQPELFVYELANVYVLRLKYREATVELLNQLQRNPREFNHVESRLAGFTKEREDALEVGEVLKAALPEHKYEFLVRKLLANLYLRIENFHDALTEYKMLEGMKDPNADQRNNRNTGKELFYFAQKASQSGKLNYAQEAYALIVSNYPESPYRIRALYGLANAKQLAGDAEDALLRYEQLIEQAPNAAQLQEAYFQIGEIYFQRFELEQAVDAFKKVLRKYPSGNNTHLAYFRIGDCYLGLGQADKARTWYERARSGAAPDQEVKDQSLYKMAYLDFLKGDYASANTILQEITYSISGAGRDQRFVNDALELVFLIEEGLQDSLALVLFSQARNLRMQKKDQEAMQKLQDLVENYGSAALVDDALLALGDLQADLGKYPNAVASFQRLLDEQPESVHNAIAMKRIGEIYEVELADLSRAAQTYEQFLIDFPHSIHIEEVRRRLRDLQSRQINN